MVLAGAVLPAALLGDVLVAKRTGVGVASSSSSLLGRGVRAHLASHWPSVLVTLRGDSFRGYSEMGCGLARKWSEVPLCAAGACKASMRSREMHTMRSLRTFIVEPLQRQGYEVAVTGLLYNCSLNAELEAFWNSLTFRSIAKLANSRQSGTMLHAVHHAIAVAPKADYHIIVRTDQTYALPIPTGAWRLGRVLFADGNSLLEAKAPASADQVHVVGREAMPSFVAALEATVAKRFPHLHFLHRHHLLRNVTIRALFPEVRGPTAVGNSAVKLLWYPNASHKSRPFYVKALP